MSGYEERGKRKEERGACLRGCESREERRAERR